MAFNLFKKTEKADVIYMNGHIYTQDSNFPWATAVACSNSKILAVGDFEAMDHLVSDKTSIVDLENKYMYPGFINAFGTPVLKTFADRYFAIDYDWDLDTFLYNLSNYVADNDDNMVYFGYGYNEEILDGKDDETSFVDLLGNIETDIPIILLGSSCVHCIYNDAAKEIIEDTAAEECVEFITTSYILNLFIPFDFEDVESSVNQLAEFYCDKGYTTLFNLCSPDYFDDIYQNSLMEIATEGTIKQRFLGSFYVNKPLIPDTICHILMSKKTSCIEIGEIVKYDTLKLAVKSSEFSQDALNRILLSVCDKGFNVHADGLDEKATLMIYKGFDLVRKNGYKNCNLVIASDYDISKELKEEFQSVDTFVSTWSTNTNDDNLSYYVTSVAEALDNLTIKASEIIGLSEQLGSIETGKLADFTVFDEDILQCNLDKFFKLHATMTIIAGEIVYDAEAEAMEELFDLLSSQQL